ncbi:hypothetical protein M0804_001564 [Polistes exclamans]|nr:hypothetical protein M0804_001564 [Polistes exclamans]
MARYRASRIFSL